MLSYITDLFDKFEKDGWEVQYKSTNNYIKAIKNQLVFEASQDCVEFDLSVDTGSARLFRLAKVYDSDLDCYLEKVIPYLNLGVIEK